MQNILLILLMPFALFCVIQASQIPLIECSQSSVANDGHCDRAIDGNTNQNYHAHSCTHTNTEKGWWRARTKEMTHFKYIRIFNRMDCCSNRLNDFSITIDGHECVRHRSGQSFSEDTFKCDKVGKVIQINNEMGEALTLCEVQVIGETIELPIPGKQLILTECLQSSTINDGSCSRAIDGNVNQNYPGLSCSHTSSEIGWWQARTTKVSKITHVRIYNRLDCCSESLNDFTVSVDGHECASYLSSGFFSVRTFECNREGQDVRISSHRAEPLMLCEVQVFGFELPNPPIGQLLPLTDCSQSSIEHEGHCDRAIDGIASQNYALKSCSSTGIEKGWWQAQTREMSLITHVRIYNRLDCCSDRLNNFAIYVDGFQCASYMSTEFFSMKTFECNRVGKVVRIVNRMVSQVTLCEVQVFGKTVQLPSPGPQVKLIGCDQSSTSNHGQCGRAIDGNMNQNYDGNSCTSTETEVGWWQGRTLKRTNITHVRIYNRIDCCSERLNDFTITVDGHQCAFYQSDGFFSIDTFECNVVGLVIRINNKKLSALHLCEVQVFGHEVKDSSIGEQLTLTDCSQSAVEHGGICQRAMDGNKNQYYNGHSCIHTNHQNSWWLAHTSKMAKISHVRIYNRLDCCSDSLSDFVITVDGHECASYRSDRLLSVETFQCDMIGQVVKISNRRPTALMMCEVQVFGSVIELTAPAKQLRLSQCSQSSTAHGGNCERAIDGIKLQNYGDHSCIHTNAEKGWWQARLQKTSFITNVRIYNRLDCCSDSLNDFSITVGGHECALYQSDGFFSVMTFECHALGQIIRIENHKMSSLMMCEVQVFGEDTPR